MTAPSHAHCIVVGYDSSRAALELAVDRWAPRTWFKVHWHEAPGDIIPEPRSGPSAPTRRYPR